jgi:uncharacterized membrane protein YoaK (UPF0700 family)
VLLTAIAGWVDAIGFISLGGFYISFMSGNTTQRGIGHTHFDMSVVRVPATLLACFVLGAFVETLVPRFRAAGTCRRSSCWKVCSWVCARLFVSPNADPCATEPLAIAMGAQNAALRSDRGHRIGGTS